MPIRVIKLGGSLFQQKTMPVRFSKFIDQLEKESETRNLVICGGGYRADLVRETMSHLSDEQQHWEAIRAMSDLTAQLCIQTGRPITTNLTQTHLEQTQIFDPFSFLQDQEPSLPGIRLPIGWHVTSDSIAARVALVLDACELILVKSVSAPSGSYSEWAQSGFVDSFFPKLANHIRSVNVITP